MGAVVQEPLPADLGVALVPELKFHLNSYRKIRVYLAEQDIPMDTNFMKEKTASFVGVEQ